MNEELLHVGGASIPFRPFVSVFNVLPVECGAASPENTHSNHVIPKPNGVRLPE